MAKKSAGTIAASTAKSLSFILLAGFLLRLVLTPYLTYSLDLYTYITWSDSLRDVGFKQFFTSNWVDYLPGYPYMLFLLAHIKQIFALTNDTALRLLYKFPAILADIATAYTIFLLTHRLKQKTLDLFHRRFSLPLLATALYLFNPAVFANSTLWGQTDSFTALAAVFGLYAVWVLSSPVVAGLSIGLGALIKLNTLLLVPLLAIGWLKTKNLKKIIIFAATTGIIFLAGFIPFNSQSPLLPFIVDRVEITTNQYRYTSLNALNIWFLLHGSWQKDTATFMGLNYHTWGNILFLSLGSVVLYSLLRRRLTLKALVQGGALIFLAAFLFLTRMHERHLFAVLPFFLLTAVATNRWRWYATISLVYVINLIFGFQQGPSNPQFLTLPSFVPRLTSLASLGLFFMLLAKFLKGITVPKISTPAAEVFHKLKIPRSSASFISKKTIVITVILTISLAVRLIRLGVPSTFYFDEVYHAFTAQEMLQGNPKAWEWWHTPPEGVAYEWTHPPLAKEFMVLGMTILGPTAVGWRFFGVLFGTANILLVYVLTKELFGIKDKFSIFNFQFSIADMAAGLYSIESLTFVQSRIGMNDTYMLFFVLLSVLLTLKQKYAAGSVSLAFALATKWSAIYMVPILAVILFRHHQWRFKTYLKPAVLFLVVPGVIYLVSYLPFFLNHSWSTFVELQKQMYWYHTRLVATHDYSSPWWSWPLLIRPVWYYVNYGAPSSNSATSAAASGLGNGWISSLLKAANAKADDQNTIANIYALGNPVIFWGGLVAIIYTVLNLSKKLISRALKFQDWSLAILITGYLAFFLPWALSPRIMFLYHYLPSIPFMVILLAWSIINLSHSGQLSKKLAISYMLLAISVFIFFYPHLTGLSVSPSWAQNFFWLKSWK